MERLSRTPVTAPIQAASLLYGDLHSLDHEELWILLLNSAHMPLAKKMITIGNIKSTLFDRRRIIKEALMANATSVIIFHNHPSGVPSPTASDIKEADLTRKACNLFDISLLDHIIMTDEAFFSLADDTQYAFPHETTEQERKRS